ncbi:hypothetical protein Cfor_09664 [Coptotermes formosanus]|uniref:Uncharacterized protein n=1 Tax=Coptotermes formosanus TaxID=36987 RepID=A0A6L2Q6W2_COPFO|nr:hypothetical protein Cfor_09664 [Coptotermes formosanus]
METSTETVDAQKAGALPHLECIDKIWKIPLVEMAWNQSAGMYGKVKEAHEVFNWTLSTAEAAVLKAAEQAAPIAKKLEQPIHAVDQTLCRGIEIVEEKLPLVKEPPSHIYEAAKAFVNSALSPSLDTVSAVKNYGAETAQSIKELSLNAANEVLATRYGNMALSGFETTAALAERCLDSYFPPTEQELQQENEPSAAEGGDKFTSTVHTVGRLSNKFARRVYNILSSQVKNLNKDNVQQYINSLATIMHLTNYLSALNQTLKATTSRNDTQNSEVEKSSSNTQKTEEKKSTIA